MPFATIPLPTHLSSSPTISPILYIHPLLTINPLSYPLPLTTSHSKFLCSVTRQKAPPKCLPNISHISLSLHHISQSSSLLNDLITAIHSLTLHLYMMDPPCQPCIAHIFSQTCVAIPHPIIHLYLFQISVSYSHISAIILIIIMCPLFLLLPQCRPRYHG